MTVTSPMTAFFHLLAQFRASYPVGCLIAELVTVHDGQFVVRALVQMSGTTLASGMAIAPDLETAEDRAKARALETLGMPQPGPLPGAPAAAPVVTTAAISPPAEVPQPLAPSSERAIAPPSPSIAPPSPSLPEPLASPPEPLSSPDLYAEPSAPIVADLYSHISLDASNDDFEATDLNSIPGITKLSKLTPPTSSKKSRRKPEPAQDTTNDVTSPPADSPIDLSDVIALTDVELRRLGWTKRQGRDYLEQTYSKSTRQELDESQLYDFLNYLKSLPSSGSAPF